MFLRDFGAIARRRWILVLVGLVMSAGLAAGGWLVTSPTYQIATAVLLLPPKSTVPEEGNPLLQLGGLDLTVDLLGKSLTDQEVTREVKALAPDAELDVGPDPSSSAPILRIQVRDKSDVAAARVRDMLVGLVPDRLRAIQDAVGVTVRNRVTMSVLVSDDTAEPVGRDKLQAAVVGGAAGLVFWAVLIVLIDNAMLRRAKRRAAGRAPASGHEPGAATRPVQHDETLASDEHAGAPTEPSPGPESVDGDTVLPGLNGIEAASEAAGVPRRRRRRRQSAHRPTTAPPEQNAVPDDPLMAGEEPAGVEAEL